MASTSFAPGIGRGVATQNNHIPFEYQIMVNEKDSTKLKVVKVPVTWVKVTNYTWKRIHHTQKEHLQTISLQAARILALEASLKHVSEQLAEVHEVATRLIDASGIVDNQDSGDTTESEMA